MKNHSRIALFVFFILTLPLCCMAKIQSAGIIKSVSGEVMITSAHQTTSIKAVPNMKIIQGDSIKTGVKGSVGLTFDDDTVISLGPNSEIVIQEFLFNPVEKKLSFVAKMIKGTFSFLSGQIIKLAPDKVQLKTPDATLAIRGTKLCVKID